MGSRICILASGSRGDVQPAIALAARLAQAGADVKLIAPKDYASLATGRGFAFHPIPVDIASAMTSPEAERFFRGGGMAAFIRWSVAASRKYYREVAAAVLDGGADVELVVATGLMDTFGGMLAERLRAPCAHAWWSPMIAAADFMFAASERPPPPVPGWASRAIYHAFDQTLWLAQWPTMRKARALFGLPPPLFAPPLRLAIARGEKLLLAYSGELLPRSREWPANVETTGFWFLDDGADWTPPPDLARFLEAGPPPVYVGFGSMAFLDREATLQAVVGALEKTGVRAIVSAGWGGLTPDRLPSCVFALDEAPHDWLFPRMAAIVHHGGAGTTGATLRAGKPSVVTPFIVDQFPWARLLHARGLAPAPLPHRALTKEALAGAIESVLGDGEMRRRAEDMGARVRAEDGLGRAVETVLKAARA